MHEQKWCMCPFSRTSVHPWIHAHVRAHRPLRLQSNLRTYGPLAYLIVCCLMQCNSAIFCPEKLLQDCSKLIQSEQVVLSESFFSFTYLMSTCWFIWITKLCHLIQWTCQCSCVCARPTHMCSRSCKFLKTIYQGKEKNCLFSPHVLFFLCFLCLYSFGPCLTISLIIPLFCISFTHTHFFKLNLFLILL